MIDNPLNRLKVLRGEDLPQAKLTKSEVQWIRSVVAERDALKEQLKNMTNKHMANMLGLHVRTIDRVTAGEGWAWVSEVADGH